MAATLRLVVARHNEDVSWLRDVPKRWHRSVITKGVDIPNEGREASSFLLAMERYYEDDGWLMFVQGDPFEHCPGLKPVFSLPELPEQFCPLGFHVVESDETGRPWHDDLPVKEYFEDLIGPWTGDVQFVGGGQFLIPSWIMRGKTLTEIRELRERVCADPKGAWVMERLWHRWLVS